AEDGPCATNSVAAVLDSAETPAFAVIAVGYDRAIDPAGDQIDALMEQFLARGVARVLWVNLTDRRRNADGTLTFTPANTALVEADAKWEQLTVLDWNGTTVADSAGRWFEKGTAVAPNWAALTATGRTRFALFVRTQLDALRSQDLLPAEVSTTPIATTTTTLDPLAPTTAPASTSTTIATTNSTPSTPPTTTSTTTATPTTHKSAVPLRTVRAGSRGSLVRQLQRRLAALGYPVKVDGSFGQATRRYVRDFQRKNGLTHDGVVGRRTWAALGY
ncbi:MAG: peptidoglycan-binding domain-containing protein, partial [Ilumatobacteraceae bacterium]